MVTPWLVIWCGYEAAAWISNFGLSLSAASATVILVKRNRRLRAKGIYLLYRVLQTLAWPAVLFYFALRAVRSAQYRRSIAPRTGTLPPSLVETRPGCIWLHAVS